MSFKKPRMLEALIKPMKSSVRYCTHEKLNFSTTYLLANASDGAILGHPQRRLPEIGFSPCGHV